MKFQKIQLNNQESSMEEVAAGQHTEKNVSSELEVDQWCRTCATKKQNLVSMMTGKSTDMSLLSKLKLLIEIDDEDALPTKMCNECVDKLEQSFKFFQQIYVADNTLRHVFPNTRPSSAPKKPLYSISKHMRNEQMEKEKEKEKEEEQQQQQDRAPKITRGIFRRGRGRPRTRGYAARARARQRSGHIPISVPSTTNSNLDDNKMYESRVNETTTLRSESQSMMLDEERQGDTVFSLLTDTCHMDEELDWLDVLKVMNDQRYQQVTSRLETETKSKEKTQKKETEEQVIESEMTELQAEATSEPSKVEMKTETEIEIKEELGLQIKMEVEAETEAEKTEDKSTTEEVQEIRCEFCGESFKLKLQLQTHLLTDHSQLSEYMCLDCLICYENESSLLKHRSLHHGDQRYRCEHCHQEFLEKRILRDHIKKCESHDTTNYSCYSCELIFSSKQELIDHVKTHPESSLIPFHSDLDNSQKIENELVPSVKATIKQEPESEYPSSVISPKDTANEISMSNPDEKYSSSAIISTDTLKTDAVEEEMQQPTDGEKSAMVTCPDCNEQMHDAMELSVHRMRRHSMNRKDATCLLCDNKSFSSLDEYEQHVLDHCKRLRISP